MAIHFLKEDTEDAKNNKGQMDKLDDIKMRNFSLSKDINKREKRQAVEYVVTYLID